MKKKRSATYILLTFTLLAASLLVTLMLPAVYSITIWHDDGPLVHDTTHHMDYHCRCDHTAVEGSMGYPDDTWTGMSIAAHYQVKGGNAAYDNGSWTYERGYGGGGTAHNYTVRDGYTICTYVVGSSSTTWYAYGYPALVTNGGYYKNCTAYYQDNYTNLASFNPSLATTLQGYTRTYFEDPQNTSNQWYVSSPVIITAQP